MNGVAKDSLRSRAEGSEASAFGMHQADAGSDAYDRDFALSLLSQEQDSLYEIDEALKRIRKAGKAPGILTPNEADAKHWLGCGGLFVAVGADVGILARGAEALAAKFKS